MYPGQGFLLSGIRVHGPRPDGPTGVEDGGLHGVAQRVHHAPAAGRARLLPPQELPAQRHQVQQYIDEQQVSCVCIPFVYIRYV